MSISTMISVEIKVLMPHAELDLRWKDVLAIKATVDQEKCTGCGQCVDVCPIEAIELDNGMAVISDECIECGACVDTCPTEAISLPL